MYYFLPPSLRIAFEKLWESCLKLLNPHRNRYQGETMSVQYFMLSWLFTIASGGEPVLTTVSFVAVFSAVCVSICIGIGLLIKKDAYNLECGNANHNSAYRGAVIAVVLCPVIFSHISENIVNVLLAVCTLILGLFMQFCTNYFIKLLLKLSR